MLIVQKYGGTSVGTIERMRAVARRCVATQRQGHDVVVIVSAMSGETNRLLGLAKQISDLPDERELDVIASTGEQVSVGLVALAIQAEGGRAVSLLGHQVRILTDSAFARARIKEIDGRAIADALKAGKIAVIAGFQGVDAQGNITTLGRGGSDTSGVAIAAALKADVCEIYTDVDGVYTADPNVVPNARKVGRISFEEMLELASLGAKVLQIRSVEFGMKFSVPIHVRSSFNDNEGTWVVPEEKAMESVLVSGVTATRDEAKITMHGISDQAGIQAMVFRPLAAAGIVVDVIVQAYVEGGRTNLTFTLPSSRHGARARPAGQAVRPPLLAGEHPGRDEPVEGVGGRRRHAVARGRRAEDVRDPGAREHRRSAHLDVRDQDLVRHRRQVRRAGRPRAPRRVRAGQTQLAVTLACIAMQNAVTTGVSQGRSPAYAGSESAKCP